MIGLNSFSGRIAVPFISLYNCYLLRIIMYTLMLFDNCFFFLDFMFLSSTISSYYASEQLPK